MRAVLFANGDIRDYSILNQYKLINNEDVIICCDGGLRHVEKVGLWPTFVLGDFDSAEHKLVEQYRKAGAKILSYPARKDETDLELGLRFAMKIEGLEEILIFGALGDRLDHSIANVQLLTLLLEKGIQGIIADEKNKVRLMTNRLTLTGKAGKLLSLLPLSHIVEGVTTGGLEYPLRDATLKIGETRGISNIFTGNEATIKITSGILMVIESRD